MTATSTSSLPWLRQAARAYRLQMSVNIALGITDVLIGLAEVWLSKQLIDAATSGHTWHLSDGGWLSLPALAAMLITCMLTSVALAYAVRWLRAKLSIRSLNRLQAGEYSRLLQSPWLYLRKQHSGTLTNTLIDDIDTISSFLSEQFPALVTAVLQFIGAFAFLAVLDWRLAIVIVIVTPAIIAAAQLYIRRMRRHRHQVREDQAAIQAFIQETIQHSLMLKALNRTAYAIACVGDQHVDLSGLVDHLFGGGFGLVRLGHITCDMCHLVSRFAAARPFKHLPATLGKQFRCRLAYTRRSAGNNYCLHFFLAQILCKVTTNF